MPVRFLLNGRETSAAEEEPHLSVLAWLRAHGVMGAKEGCAEGECGACAVAVGTHGRDGETQYSAVNACIFPFASLAGRSLITVEGVGTPDALHPVQQALVAHAGSQCGYCTPGFVISLFCAYERDPRSCRDAEVIAGNLCRCTGYRPIVAAQQALAEAPAETRRRLPQLAEPARSASERFRLPRSLAELFAERARHPDAVLIAGGTDLMVYANQQHRRFNRLISLEHVAELLTVTHAPDELVIGAAVPLNELDALAVPMLAQLWPLFSSRLVRSRATLGGSLATASPIGDAAPALIALGASLVLASPAGSRRVPVEDFFRGYRQTVLARDELIQAVCLPNAQAPIQRFYKLAKRAADDISTVAAGFALGCDASGHVVHFRVAYGGIAATPLRATPLESWAIGKLWNADTVCELVARSAKLGTPQDDHRGSARYRKAMLGRLIEKFYADTRGAPGP